MQGSDKEFQGLELSLRDYVTILARHKWLVLGVFAATVCAMVGWTLATPSSYQSTATVVLRTTNNQQLFPSVGTSQRSQFIRTPAAELEFANSSFFAADARAASPSTATVQPRYDEGDDRRSSQLDFVATAGDPFDAQTAALSWAELYLETRSASEVDQIAATIAGVEALVVELEAEKAELLLPLKPIDDALLEETDSDTISRLTTQRLSLQQSFEDDLLPISLQLRTLSQDLSSLRIAAGFVTQPNISARLSIEPAPGRKVAPNVSRNLALAPLLGLMLAAGAALLNESFRGVINSDKDLAAVAPGIPVLTQLPEFGRRTNNPLDLAADPGTPYAQALERVVSSLLYERVLRPSRQLSVMVTSSVSGEGKTTLASHLALRLDSTPARTVLVDADLRRPDVHIAYGQGQAQRGLSDLLQSRSPLGPHLHGLNRAKRVRALFAGSATDNAAALLRQAFPDAVNSLRPLYDVLVVDAPPVLAVTDAEVMAHSVDGVLVAVRAGKTSRAQLSETLRKLSAVDARIIGFVLVAVKSSVGYGYAYNYGYHSTGAGQLPYSVELLDQDEAQRAEREQRVADAAKQRRSTADQPSQQAQAAQQQPVRVVQQPAEQQPAQQQAAQQQPEQQPPQQQPSQQQPVPVVQQAAQQQPAQQQPVPVVQRPAEGQPASGSAPAGSHEPSDKVAARRQAAKQRAESPLRQTPPQDLASPWLDGFSDPTQARSSTPRSWPDAVTVRDTTP